MSDDLRTRIAAVVSERYRNDPTNDVEGWAANLADAVIRELNLDISTTYKTSQGREVCIEGFWTEEVTDE